MTVTGTRTIPALGRARFDPRMVVAGFVLLALGTVSGYVVADQAVTKAGQVAAPVTAICQQGGPAGAQLADTGACGAAADAADGIGPFVSVPGPAGADGARGAPGADSQVPGPPGGPGKAGEPGADSKVPGPPGKDGADGEDGADGVSPACLSEPGQCRGKDGAPGEPGKDGAPGRDGADGAQGPPGPTCPDGTSLQPVMFASGQEGLGCVTNDDPAEPTT